MGNGTKVVLLTDEFAPWVSQGAVGEVYDYEPGDEQYVDFDWSDASIEARMGRVYCLRSNQFRIATEEEIAQGLGEVTCQ